MIFFPEDFIYKSWQSGEFTRPTSYRAHSIPYNTLPHIDSFRSEKIHTDPYYNLPFRSNDYKQQRSDPYYYPSDQETFKPVSYRPANTNATRRSDPSQQTNQLSQLQPEKRPLSQQVVRAQPAPVLKSKRPQRVIWYISSFLFLNSKQEYQKIFQQI
jgi:hypothetical protein